MIDLLTQVEKTKKNKIERIVNWETKVRQSLKTISDTKMKELFTEIDTIENEFKEII